MDNGRAVELVSNFVTQALRGLPLTIYGDGAQARSRSHIDDVMEALGRYFSPNGIEFAGPANIGKDREATVIDLARYVVGCVPGSLMEHLAHMPRDPTNRRLDLSRARSHGAR